MPRLRALLPLLLLTLVPASFYVLRLPEFGRLPYNDYYGVIAKISTEDGQLATDPRVWLGVKSNEHRVTLPALIYAANSLLFGGTNYGHSAVALLLLFLIAGLVISFLPAELRQRPLLAAVPALTVGAFVFTPVAAHNVVMGFSGIMWFLSNALAVGAMAVLVHTPPEAPARRLWPIPVLGLMGAFTYSSHLSLWPALLVGLLLLPGRRSRWLPVGLGGALVFLLYFSTHRQPEHHEKIYAKTWEGFWSFSKGYFGSLFSHQRQASEIYGFWGLMLGLVLLLALCLPAVRRHRVLLASWLMLLVYAVANNAGTAAARSGAPGMALASRYASLPGFYWLSLIMILALLCWCLIGRPRIRMAAILLLVALPGAWLVQQMYERGVREMGRQLDKAALQKMGELAVLQEVRDEIAIRTVCRWPAMVLWARPYMRRAGNVPYDREIPRLGPGQPRPELRQAAEEEADGVLEAVRWLPGRRAAVSGWLRSERKVAELLVADQKRRAWSPMAYGLPSDDLADLAGEQYRRSGWGGYVKPDCDSRRLKAYVRFAGDEQFHPLQITHKARHSYRQGQIANCGDDWLTAPKKKAGASQPSAETPDAAGDQAPSQDSTEAD